MLPLVDTFAIRALGSLLLAIAVSWSGWRCWRSLKLQRGQQRSLVDRINGLLPQTQCGHCGYEGCRPYARAILQGERINKCPPGGGETILRLARLLNETEQTLDPAHGAIKPQEVAVIREAECIGCTKCIVACPLDAIIGGPKLMHTVIETECSGCDLCVEPCPVDCIDMVTKPQPKTWRWELPGSLPPMPDKMETAP